MAQLYRTDGTTEVYPEPADGTAYTLEQLRAATQLVTLFAGDFISGDALVCRED